MAEVVSGVTVDGRVRFGDRLRAGLTVGSWVGALLLWWACLRPTLLPRSAFVQGAIGGICIAVGYGLGGLAGGSRTSCCAGAAPTSRPLHTGASSSPWRPSPCLPC